MGVIGVDEVSRLFGIGRLTMGQILPSDPVMLYSAIVKLIASSLGVTEQQAETILQNVQNGTERVIKSKEAAARLGLSHLARVEQQRRLAAFRPICFVINSDPNSTPLQRFLLSIIITTAKNGSNRTKPGLEVSQDEALSRPEAAKILCVSPDRLSVVLRNRSTCLRVAESPGAAIKISAASVIAEIGEAMAAVTEGAQFKMAAEDFYLLRRGSQDVRMITRSVIKVLLDEKFGRTIRGTELERRSNQIQSLIIFSRLETRQKRHFWLLTDVEDYIDSL